MKRKIMAMLTAGLLVLGLAGCGAQSTAQTPPESVTASGAGKATAAADVAELSLGVESEGGSTEAVRQKNAEAVQAAVEFLTGMGVAEADIRTDSVNLSERYGGGYEMSTRITVLVRELDRAGEAIDGVVNAGVNEIYSVEYGVADEAALYKRALELAAADARESAQKMAEAAGRTLGEVIRRGGGLLRWGRTGAPAGRGRQLCPGIPLLAGDLSVTAGVRVTYELK